MFITNGARHDIEGAESYMVIVDSRGHHNVKPRCLSNFENYVVIGLAEHSDECITYSLIATENLPEFYVTHWYDERHPPKHSGPLIEKSDNIINKQILIRAKDLKYKSFLYLYKL